MTHVIAKFSVVSIPYLLNTNICSLLVLLSFPLYFVCLIHGFCFLADSCSSMRGNRGILHYPPLQRQSRFREPNFLLYFSNVCLSSGYIFFTNRLLCINGRCNDAEQDALCKYNY